MMSGKTTTRTAESKQNNIDALIEQITKEEGDNNEQKEPIASRVVNPFDRAINRMENPTELKRNESLTYEFAAKNFERILSAVIKKPLRLTEKQKNAIGHLIYYFLNDPDSHFDLRKGVYLYGDVGCGKTSIMKAFQKFASVTHIKKFKLASTSEISRKIVARSSSEIMMYYSGDEFTQRRDYPTFCFDDLGLEGPCTIYGSKINPMEEILFARYEKRLLTHATSNLKPERIKEKYGKRVFSRLHEMFNIIYLDGIDHRMKK